MKSNVLQKFQYNFLIPTPGIVIHSAEPSIATLLTPPPPCILYGIFSRVLSNSFLALFQLSDGPMEDGAVSLLKGD